MDNSAQKQGIDKELIIDPRETLRTLRGSVVQYDDPLEPVGLEDWEAIPNEKGDPKVARVHQR